MIFFIHKMMIKIYINIILLISFKIILSAPNCQEGSKLCSRCHPITKLCIKCEKDIYAPDEDGGCVNAKKCTEGNHHCSKCDEDGKLCKTCEESYYPDENGGCSYSNNCAISYEGKCLICKEDFILIGKTDYYYDDDIKICKSINSEDLKNCQKIDIERGICQICNNGYYLTSGDIKCTMTQYCYESSFGVCRQCSYGYYLDKLQQKCLKQEGVFDHCRESIDGITCDKCDDDYYFDEEGLCGGTNYCAVRGEYTRCKQCINGYYLSNYGDCCTKEKNCYYGNKDLGICTACIDNYCLDFKDGKCKSNTENDEYKYCKAADGECTSCEFGYYLGKDYKCCNTRHCSESYNGKCEECEDNYYLGLDNRCNSVEHCIYSTEYEECLECDNNYYYNKNKKNCKIAEGKFKNCKSGNENGNCERCRNDFYLSRKDYLCYDNNEKGPFYKCAYSDSMGEYCTQCIDNYYLGYLDDKCTNIEGCDLSENENKCLECDEYYCLNLKDNRCYPNDEISDESKKFYYKCNRTNSEGNTCEICLEGFVLNENGLCIDEEHCSYKQGGICKACKDDEYASYCLNNIFGCVEYYSDNCLECNQLLDFGNCTKCETGFILDEYSQCVEVDYMS